jgi:hypothetical protein
MLVMMFAITAVLRLRGMPVRPHAALAAENLFLRRQLGLYTVGISKSQAARTMSAYS